MKYAPVLITTLNRHVHLKNLIESLEKNPWSIYTDLIISLDYPPKESYKEGYEKNRKYLHYLKKSNKFHKFILFEQNHNLGAFDNSNFLVEYCLRKYDRWICTEDDNIFSPNFLEYMDKGLELFENDDSVYAICACCNELKGDLSKGNVFRQILVGPYGIGFWKKDFLGLKANVKKCLLSKENYTFKSMKALSQRSGFLFSYYISTILCDNTNEVWKEGNIIEIDLVSDLYLYFERLSCIFPVEYKGHNDGADGSGLHTFKSDIDPDIEWPLDTKESFDFILPENFSINDESYTAMSRLLSVSISHMVRIWAKYIVFRILGSDTERMKVIFNNFRRIKKRIKNDK